LHPMQVRYRAALHPEQNTKLRRKGMKKKRVEGRG